MALGLNTSSAPDWANKWSEKLQLVVNSLISVQTRIIADTSLLPDPEIWKGRQLWTQDLNRLLISDGTDWRRTDDGTIV
jgi:hypothetical protein